MSRPRFIRGVYVVEAGVRYPSHYDFNAGRSTKYNIWAILRDHDGRALTSRTVDAPLAAEVATPTARRIDDALEAMLPPYESRTHADVVRALILHFADDVEGGVADLAASACVRVHEPKIRVRIVKPEPDWRAILEAAHDCGRALRVLQWTLPDDGSNYWRTYGLPHATVVAAWAKQDERCAICLARPGRFVVDHCHDSDVVRGLLCGRCNTRLGHRGDRYAWMELATWYLGRVEGHEVDEVARAEWRSRPRPIKAAS